MEKYGYKEKCHELAELYDYILSDLRDKEIHLLEIGIAWGGSIKMWSEYFKNGKIYGIDNVPFLQQINRPFTDDRITALWGDAYSSEFTDYLTGEDLKFDIILDDGPHTLASQEWFIDNFINFVKPGGYLIVEDISGIENARRLHEKLIPKVKFSFLVDRTRLTGQDNEITLFGVK
jgi:cephalosporin hydroxylase